MARCFFVSSTNYRPQLVSFDGHKHPYCVSTMATGRRFALFVTTSNELFISQELGTPPRRLPILESYIASEREHFSLTDDRESRSYGQAHVHHHPRKLAITRFREHAKTRPAPRRVRRPNPPGDSDSAWEESEVSEGGPDDDDQHHHHHARKLREEAVLGFERHPFRTAHPRCWFCPNDARMLCCDGWARLRNELEGVAKKSRRRRRQGGDADTDADADSDVVVRKEDLGVFCCDVPMCGICVRGIKHLQRHNRTRQGLQKKFHLRGLQDLHDDDDDDEAEDLKKNPSEFSRAKAHHVVQDMLADEDDDEVSLFGAGLTPEDREITHISCGQHHAFVVYGGKFVFAFGQNLSGQLGLGHHCRVPDPVRVEGFPPPGYVVRDVKCGRSHSVFAINNQELFHDWDELWVCGSGVCGQTGFGRVSLNLPQPDRLRFLHLKKDEDAEDKKKEEGEETAVLSAQSKARISHEHLTRLESSLFARRRVEKLTCGENCTMMILSKPARHSDVEEEGEGAEDIGPGAAEIQISPSESQAKGEDTREQLAVAFGDNSFGQLGCDNCDFAWVPTAVTLPPEYRDHRLLLHVACGSSHSLLVTDNRVLGAGVNASQQLGADSIRMSGRFAPVEFPEFVSHRVLAVCAGEDFSIVVVASRQAVDVPVSLKSELKSKRRKMMTTAKSALTQISEVVKLFSFGGRFAKLEPDRHIRTKKRITMVCPQENAFYFLSE